MSASSRWIFPALALAAGITLTQARASAMEPLQVVGSGGAHFMSGGVGERERAAFFEQVTGHDLLVSFARRSDGAYVSHVDVKLEGRPLDAPVELTTAGPYLLADLPAGHYTLSASLEGWATVRREVDVNRNGLNHVHVTFEPSDS